MITLELAMEAKSGSKEQLYSFFNLGARWGWVVNAAPRFSNVSIIPPMHRTHFHLTGHFFPA
jgi:hypothetical protein